MDKKIIDRETHDLMNVDSFSQLPFIRPPPKEKGIRLFGIEFGCRAAAEGIDDSSESLETTFEVENHNTNKETNPSTNNSSSNNSNSGNNNNENNRRFECHYCCRNFPTSQALGGHQNAHKRERQHAKRQHLQSTMVHATSFSDPHLYHHHHHHQQQQQQHPFYRFTSSSPSSLSSSPSYPTWNSNSNSATARFYNHPTSSYSQQPINGSPLAFWRIPNGTVQSNPSFNHERPSHLLVSEERANPSQDGHAHGVVRSNVSHNRYVYDTKRSDHVSLDLHL